MRRPDLLRPVFHRVLGCSALRQIAAEFGVAPSTILRQVERLGRHCLLVHERWRPRGAPAEVLVLDGFRSFEAGQYWPFDANLLVGASHFVYGFNDAELRRSGRLTPAQQRKRARLEHRYGRPHPQATRRAVAELVARVVPPGAHTETARNPLFPANLADLLIRHTGANHKRETIAFSKRRQGALYRLAIWQVWRNYLKWRSERRREATPAQALGLVERRLTLEEVLGERLFPGCSAATRGAFRPGAGHVCACIAHASPSSPRRPRGEPSPSALTDPICEPQLEP
jgi:hypothetical protein